MALSNGLNSIIHSVDNMDTSRFAYYQVYAGVNTTAIINGEEVNMFGGTLLDIRVKTLSGSNLYVLGSPLALEKGILSLSK